MRLKQISNHTLMNWLRVLTEAPTLPPTQAAMMGGTETGANTHSLRTGSNAWYLLACDAHSRSISPRKRSWNPGRDARPPPVQILLQTWVLKSIGHLDSASHIPSTIFHPHSLSPNSTSTGRHLISPVILTVPRELFLTCTSVGVGPWLSGRRVKQIDERMSSIASTLIKSAGRREVSFDLTFDAPIGITNITYFLR